MTSQSRGDVLGGNLLRIVTEDHPTRKGMSPRTWQRRSGYHEWEFGPAFEAFARQRAELLAVVEPLAPQDWERTATVTGMLGETCEISARLLRRLAGPPRAGAPGEAPAHHRGS